MTIFLVFESLQTHPNREPKMVSLLVRNYSIHFHCCCCCCCCYFFICCCLFCCFCFYFFQSLAHFMSTNTKPSGTIGETQKTMTISATSFRGCNRFSPLLISSIVIDSLQSNLHLPIFVKTHEAFWKPSMAVTRPSSSPSDPSCWQIAAWQSISIWFK